MRYSGFFSFLASDTGRPVTHCYSVQGSLPVRMMVRQPDGTILAFDEIEYEGEGVFGCMDFFVALAEMNNCPPMSWKSEHDQGKEIYYAYLDSCEGYAKAILGYYGIEKETMVFPQIVENLDHVPNWNACPKIDPRNGFEP
jgi:hypothetical protein